MVRISACLQFISLNFFFKMSRCLFSLFLSNTTIPRPFSSENIRDLLGSDPTAQLNLREDPDRGVYVVGLTQTVVKNAEQILDLMNRGNKLRAVGFTEMNSNSSRSHSIFVVHIETAEKDPANPSENKIRAGKLNLVDLAGSERQSKTQVRVCVCLFSCVCLWASEVGGAFGRAVSLQLYS